MKGSCLIRLWIKIIFAIAFQSCNSSKPIADEKSTHILNQYKKAIGGIENINSINNFRSAGEWKGIGTQLYIVEVPDKFFIETQSEDLHERVIFNNGKIKMLRNNKEISESFNYLKKEFELDARLNSLAYVNELAEKTTYLGETERDGNFYYQIEVKFKNGVIWTAEFDKNTFLLSSLKRTDIQMFFSDYREVNGVKFPFLYIYKIPDGQKLTLEVTSIDCNITMNENLFEF